MTAPWAIPLLAGIVSAVFAGLVWRRFSERRRLHQLAWAAGLSLYAFASFVEVAVDLRGWSVGLYRLYFTAASGLVGLLGLGTVYLLRAPRAGHAFAVLVAAGLLLAGLGQLAVPLALDTPVPAQEGTRPFAEWGTDLGAKAVPFPHPARFASLALNVLGGLALIGGALASWWQTRARGVLLIGLGALVPFAGGSLSTLSVVHGRVLAQLLGIVVMFAGYLASREPPSGRPAALASQPT